MARVSNHGEVSYFSFLEYPDGCGTHPSFLFSGQRSTFLPVKLPEINFDNLPPSGVGAQNELNCASTSLYDFVSWTGTTAPIRRVRKITKSGY